MTVTDADVDAAREMGRQLALQLTAALRPRRAPTLRYGTITGMQQDTDGRLTANVSVAGTVLDTVPVTVDCATARVGDRCVVQTSGNLSTVTGLLASPGTIRPPHVERGTVNITAGSNHIGSTKVTFTHPFDKTPVIVATVCSRVPSTAIQVAYQDQSRTGCTLYMYRTDTANTEVSWIAVEQP